MESYLLLVLSAVLLAVNFALTKLFQTYEGTEFSVGMLFNALVGLFSAILFFAIGGFKVHITLFSAAMALFQTATVVIYTLIGFKIMEKENVSDYTFFLMTGGMIVPYIWGLLFLKEKLTVLNALGIVIITVSILLINGNGKKNLRLKLMCWAIFLLNGMTSVFAKMHQIDNRAISSGDFVFLTSIIKSVICFVIFLFVSKKVFRKDFGKASLVLTVLVSTVSGISYLLQLNGASVLPATVCYPMITGGTIIFTAIAGALCFKEKIKAKFFFGILLCLIGTCLFL